jgi:hypothetical protein
LPHFVLAGENSDIRAELMSRTDAEKWIFPEEAVMEDIQNISEPVWLVQIQGDFQIEGGPPPESGTQLTDMPPMKGTCWVIIDAQSGENLNMRSTSNIEPGYSYDTS